MGAAAIKVRQIRKRLGRMGWRVSAQVDCIWGKVDAQGFDQFSACH
jgi:hypothetical protein